MSIKETKFYNVSSKKDARDGISSIEDRFVHDEKGFLTSKELKELSDTLVTEITTLLEQCKNDSAQTEIILDMLRIDAIKSLLLGSSKYSLNLKEAPQPVNWDYTDEYLDQMDERKRKNEQYEQDGIYTISWNDEEGIKQNEDITLEELEQYLAPMRKYILEQLSHSVNRKILTVVNKRLTPDGRVWEAHDNKIVKRSFDHDYNRESQNPEDKKNYHQALVILFNTREHSPHLAYQIQGSDFATDHHEGIELHNRINITTLEEVLNKKPLIQLEKTLRYFSGVCKGLSFIVDHDLRLTDLTPHNIAIDNDSDKSLLFDYDGLRTKEYEMNGYMTHPGHVPPERIPEGAETSNDPLEVFAAMSNPPKQVKKPIEESEMVYEMGVTLQKIIEKYENVPNNIKALQERMTSTDPKNRPPFEDLIHTLNEKNDSSIAG